ncbi:MAG TPA: hypothetical protein DCZ13_12140 [Porticoccaceae bacterium]|nr:hypothetical protein [Porticoccaceae bacterium]
MTDDQGEPFLEPMRMWREWYQRSEKQWSEALTDIMADEKFGKTWGRMFQEWLHAQHMMAELIGQQLAALNMPSRSDILSIRDRVGEMEDSVSALTAEIVQLRQQMKKTAATNAEKPQSGVKRTRKPAAKKTPVDETGKTEASSVAPKTSGDSESAAMP